ncbi:MAG: OmpA family protein [Deltaproteobacteria bacterium]|nr:OmpA family protein [Deltaproteobacteria bacterium]
MSATFRGVSLFAVGALSLCVGLGQASAQMPPADLAIDVQLFDYAVGPRSFITVNDATTQEKSKFNLDFLVTYLTDPFTVYNVTEDDNIIDTRTELITSLFAGQLSGAYGLTSKIHIGAMLPVIFSMNGNELDPASASSMGDYQVAGLGDLRVEAKFKLWERNRLSFAAAPIVTVPTSIGGNSGDLMGDDLPTFRGYGSAMWKDGSGQFTVGANAGFIFRKPREIYASEISQQLTYGLAGMYHPTEKFQLVVETYGRTGFANFAETHTSPWEAQGAGRFFVSPTIHVLAGAGAGLNEAIGSPRFRFFASVGWAPDYGDKDGDGISNLKDGCPLVPEDKDGFEDNDGCPDKDNDGDLIYDDEDKCPDKREDKDGFADEDGCPELDNDNDGIPDAKDRCKNDPEDKKKPFPTDGCPMDKTDIDFDGISDDKDQCIEEEEDKDEFEDWDGCPDADNDKDGVPDEDDECPLCAEDKDGFADGDGCPELDNDNDGIADAQDKCPNKAETYNGTADDDGCPDSGGRAVVTLDGDRIDYKGAIKFKRGKLDRKAKKLLAQIGVLMKSQSMVAKWRVVVAITGGGSAADTKIKAQVRATQVKNELIAAGVPADRIEAIGLGAKRELVAVSIIERISNDSRDQCPAQYLVKPREPGAATTTAPATPVEPKQPDPPAAVAPAAGEVAVTQDSIKIGGKVQFKTGSYRIKTESFALLDKVAQVFKDNPQIKKVQIEGHTDDAGKYKSNLYLSRRRAQAVKKYLVNKGVSRKRLTAKGFGPDRPMASNDSAAGREANRRVEFKITVTEE